MKSISNIHYNATDKVRVYISPKLEEVANLVNNYWDKYVLVSVLDCTIDYIGRAGSKASKATRLLITKPDGTLMVHEGVKHHCLNWNPPGSSLTAELDNGLLVITSVRRRPREIIRIISDRVHVFMLAEITRGEFILWGDEKDMINYVLKNPDVIEKGFKPIATEYRTSFGIVDLLGRDSLGRLVVLEFKRSKASLSAVSQLKRYADALKARGILVAPDITPSARALLEKYGLEFRKLSPKVKD